jgi:hypothetical protein
VDNADEEASVYWTVDQAISADIMETDAAVETNPDCNSPTDTETFSFVADHAEHHGQTLQCKASNSADITGKNDNINLDVHGKEQLKCCYWQNVNTLFVELLRPAMY